MTRDRTDAGSITESSPPGLDVESVVIPTRRATWVVSPLRVILVGLGVTALLTTVAIAANSEPLSFAVIETQPSERTETQSVDLGPAEDVEIEETEAPKPAEPIEIPRAVLIAIGVIVGAIALYYLSLQRLALRFRKSPIAVTPTIPALTAEEEAEEIVKVTRDLIDELGQGDDPRVAIQRAYAAVETGFGAHDLERKRSETPIAYLERVLGQNGEVAEPLRELTKLFEVARFSPKVIDESMRREAIAALSVIRDSYQRQAVDSGRP